MKKKVFLLTSPGDSPFLIGAGVQQGTPVDLEDDQFMEDANGTECDRVIQNDHVTLYSQWKAFPADQAGTGK